MLQPQLRLQVNTASADVNLLDELSLDAKAGDEDDGGDGQKAQSDLAARVAAMEAQLSRIAELQVCPCPSALPVTPCDRCHGSAPESWCCAVLQVSAPFLGTLHLSATQMHLQLACLLVIHCSTAS